MVQVNPPQGFATLFSIRPIPMRPWYHPYPLCILSGDLLIRNMNRTRIALTVCALLLICGLMAPAVSAVLPVPGSIDRPGPRIGGGVGYYRIHCDVDGATVFFDNVYQGTIRLGMLLARVYTTGTPYSTIDVKADGYAPYHEPLPGIPLAGKILDIEVAMTPAGGESGGQASDPAADRTAKFQELRDRLLSRYG
jgi:hypothetical protein